MRSHPIAEAEATITAGTQLTVIEPGVSPLVLDLPRLWRYREILGFLVWRDLKVRYKQTALGVFWAILQPLFTVVILTVVFRLFVDVPSDGHPYPVFAYAALLPWYYVSQAVTRGGNSLIANVDLIGKVYFPRLFVPLASILTPLVDLALAFFVLIAMMVVYGIVPSVGVFLLPVFVLLAALSALAFSLWLSALNVRFRDVCHTIPFLIQVWMLASPIAYPLSIVPERWRLLYSLNPMVGVIEGFRWALLGGADPSFSTIAIGTSVVLVLLGGGLVYFNTTERTFADII